MVTHSDRDNWYCATIAVALMAMHERELHVVVEDDGGSWRLPRAFGRVGPSESIAGALTKRLIGRELVTRIYGGHDIEIRQDGSRKFVLGYAAAAPWDRAVASLTPGFRFASMTTLLQSENTTYSYEHKLVREAKHDAVHDLDRSRWSFGFLADEFTINDLQAVHEALRGGTLNKTAFRKRVLSGDMLVPTGRLQVGHRYRPAELYRVNENWADDVIFRR